MWEAAHQLSDVSLSAAIKAFVWEMRFSNYVFCGFMLHFLIRLPELWHWTVLQTTSWGESMDVCFVFLIKNTSSSLCQDTSALLLKCPRANPAESSQGCLLNLQIWCEGSETVKQLLLFNLITLMSWNWLWLFNFKSVTYLTADKCTYTQNINCK